MPEENGKIIGKVVGRARQRLRLHRFLLAASYLLPLVLFAAVIELVSLQFWPHIGGTLFPINVVLASLAAIWLVWMTFRGTGVANVSRELDVRANLADRISSAVEFLTWTDRKEIFDAQIRNAGSAASGISVGALFPFAWKVFAKRLFAGLLFIPLLFLLSRTDLPGLFPEERVAEQQAEETFAEPEPGQEVTLLEETGLDREIMQLIRPAEELIRQWKERLKQVEEQQAAEAEEEPEELPGEEILPPETVLTTMTKNLGEARTLAVEPKMNQQRIRVSDLAALVDKEKDGEYGDAFEYLDKQLFGEDGAKLEQIAQFVDNTEKQAEDKRISGNNQATQARFAGENNPGVENNKQGAMMNQLQGAQSESFSEFLSEYAAHMNRMLAKMQGIINQAEKDQKDPNVKEQFKLAESVPQDAPRIMMKEITEKDLREGNIRKLAPDEAGDSRAGYGFGTPEGAYKVPKVEKEATQYAELDSQFGEGDSIQILEDLEEGDTSRYSGLFRNYAIQAEDLLSQEDIPAAIQNYVRAYFLAISPDNVNKD